MSCTPASIPLSSMQYVEKRMKKYHRPLSLPLRHERPQKKPKEKCKPLTSMHTWKTERRITAEHPRERILDCAAKARHPNLKIKPSVHQVRSSPAQHTSGVSRIEDANPSTTCSCVCPLSGDFEADHDTYKERRISLIEPSRMHSILTSQSNISNRVDIDPPPSPAQQAIPHHHLNHRLF